MVKFGNEPVFKYEGMLECEILDHCIYYRDQRGRAAGIVSQPYSVPEEAETVALLNGCRIEFPEYESFYGHGTTLILLLPETAENGSKNDSKTPEIQNRKTAENDIKTGVLYE